MRADFANKLNREFSSDVKTLMIVIECNQEEMDGPPFSITQAKVNDQFGGRFRVEQLTSRPLDPLPPHMAEQGLKALTNVVYKLQPAKD